MYQMADMSHRNLLFIDHDFLILLLGAKSYIHFLALSILGYGLRIK